MVHYVGQTARAFETRIKEHNAAFRNKSDRSNFAYHLYTENHEFDKEMGVELLHFCEGGRRMDVLENVEIRRVMRDQSKKILNVQLELKNSPIISFLASC
uniref:GIY-YIG domain-containing protein n=1 Tax=Cacopsylla melanoneura TaxID=428564 RepID=A0A8D8M6Y2_9HEMI